MMKPKYKNKPIGSIKSLSRFLSLPPNRLKYLARNSSRYYYLSRVITKPDGSKRKTYDVRKDLKDVHRSLKNKLFSAVYYPEYLQGGVKGKNYLMNVCLHTSKGIIISEDVSNFFPTITEVQVFKLFTNFFCFPHDVSDTLAKLVCYKGTLQQGCITSSYVANLILWNREYSLVQDFSDRGLTYTRYIDDITVSSMTRLSKDEISGIIKSIYGMLYSIDVTPNRNKHTIMTKGKKQQIHKVNANLGTPKFTKHRKGEIRSAVHLCTKAFNDKNISVEDYKRYFNKASGLVGMLKQLEPKQAQRYRAKLSLITPKYKQAE
ncbi:reverse transcriptase family protein [Photobacterium alginatilyticum]|uniref:reverse transcriptase family protein n=1 Tax=Photobacterium alginatilyticum TaxID=1775171 RepID=UPI0040688925